MAGYWNRDIPRDVEPFRAYCTPEHLPVERTPYWRAITDCRADKPYSFVDYLRKTFGGREALVARLHNVSPYGDRQSVRDHAERMSLLATPDGYAWTPWLVGAPCEVCGTDC